MVEGRGGRMVEGRGGGLPNTEKRQCTHETGEMC